MWPLFLIVAALIKARFRGPVREEAALLGNAADPDEMYLRHVLPEKVTLGKQYLRGSSLKSDVVLIAKTLAAVSRLKVP